ncbi:unnamed protein product [Clonostachys byssicola]|uniref:FAD dependent oxidoreductase domain-containing protein n=1 Tax=Clonostachys byssicola TaxID=160290 RepID=A0A9N9U1Z7_9HYPO|nr:unnamed protein product [Clonostachys byssicola]
MGIGAIIIVGAGVVALSTAYDLLAQHPATRVLIIAAELPTDPASSWTADYASMWAGAHYRPIAPSTPQLRAEFALAQNTHRMMKRIARDKPESGCGFMGAVEYMENPGERELQLKSRDIFAGEGDGFRVLSPEELPDKVKWGCEYDAYCIDTQKYCQWLLHQIQKTGQVRVLRRQLSQVLDAFEAAEAVNFPKAKIVVNCSGRGFGDPKSKIVRGQTVLVKQQYHKSVTRQCADGSWTFLIPRPNMGGTIVGGTKEEDDWRSEPRESTRKAVLQKAVECFPYFVDDVSQFEVIRDNVGRRPFRDGGLRMELEELDGDRRIVHGYGAGSRGYELSWGIAGKLVKLLEQATVSRASL